MTRLAINVSMAGWGDVMALVGGRGSVLPGSVTGGDWGVPGVGGGGIGVGGWLI